MAATIVGEPTGGAEMWSITRAPGSPAPTSWVEVTVTDTAATGPDTVGIGPVILVIPVTPVDAPVMPATDVRVFPARSRLIGPTSRPTICGPDGRTFRSPAPF